MWYDAITVWMLDSPMHGLLSENTMVISYTGRKSGKAYRVPVGYLRIDEILLTISYKRRTWWRSLRGGAFVSLRLLGNDVRAYAEVIEDDQGVADGLKAFIEENPQAARIFGLKPGKDGKFEAARLYQAARERVIVRSVLR